MTEKTDIPSIEELSEVTGQDIDQLRKDARAASTTIKSKTNKE
jgi:hypothetical protein